MLKITNRVGLIYNLQLLLSIFMFNSSCEVIAMHLAKPLPARFTQDWKDIKPATKEFLNPDIKTMKENQRKLGFYGSLYSVVQQNPTVMWIAQKLRELVGGGQEARAKTLKLATHSLQNPSFSVGKKIKDYTLEQIVDGINYMTSGDNPSDKITKLFTQELVSRGYPYHIEGDENKAISERLNPDVQERLFINHAISSLKDRIIDTKDPEKMKQVISLSPDFFFNTLAFSSHADRLIVGASDDQSNSKVMTFLSRDNDMLPEPRVHDFKEKDINSMSLKSDDKTIAIWGNDGKFSLIMDSLENESKTYSLSGNSFLSIKFRPHSSQIIALAEDGLYILNQNDQGGLESDYEIEEPSPQDKKFKTCVMSSDGQSLFVGTSSGRIITYIFEANELKRVGEITLPYDDINELRVSYNNKDFVVAVEDKLIFGSFGKDDLEEFGNPVISLEYIEGTHKVVVQAREGDQRSNLFLATIPESSSTEDLIDQSDAIVLINKQLGSLDGALSMAVSPNGEKIAVGFKGKLIIWNLLSSEDKKMLNDLGATLTRDHAQLISSIIDKLNKQEKPELKDQDINNYDDLSSAVKDLLLGDI